MEYKFKRKIPGRKGHGMPMHTKNPREPGKKYIFRPYIVRNGVTYWAKNYGLRAFPILIDDDD